MARELKVYYWRTPRSRPSVGTFLSLEVMAAPTVASVLNAANITRTNFAEYGGVTSNPEHVTRAMSKPGTIFWTDESATPAAWRELPTDWLPVVPEEDAARYDALRVFTWHATRTPEFGPRVRTTEVMAAASEDDVRRITGTKSLIGLTVTDMAVSEVVAWVKANPGAILWQERKDGAPKTWRVLPDSGRPEGLPKRPAPASAEHRPQ